METGEKVKVRIKSGTPRQYLSYVQTYIAIVEGDLGNGDLELKIVDDTGATMRTTLLRSRHLNGGDFKIVLKGVRDEQHPGV